MPSKKTRSFMPESNINLVGKNLKDFFYWMHERQNIWYKRFVLKEERPWTKDKILKEFKFTNVYRELDRNTQWLIKNVIDKKNIGHKEVLWKIIVFRYFNKTELFDEIGLPDHRFYNMKKYHAKVLKFKEEYGRVFTSAYMINPPKQKEDIKLGLEGFYCKNINTVYERLDDIWASYGASQTPEDFVAELIKLPCVAGFIAYEIYCDLTYTDWFKFKDEDFVNVGPGAKFGLELLFPSFFVNRKLSRYENMIKYLSKNSAKFFDLFGLEDFKYYNKNNPKHYATGKKVGLRCIEHSLCEYSKYFKMKMKVGKPRQHFETIITKNNFFIK